MVVGCVKEIKDYEFRVGLTPDNVHAYVLRGHEVLMESGAGAGSGFTDADYEAVGAKLCADAAEVWEKSQMIVKVKEPLESEYDLMQPGQILFTYLHLVANRPLTEALLRNKVKAVAYEAIYDEQGGLPLLKPMSEIAGRLSVQEGAKCLEKPMGGSGILLGGIPGVPRGHVVILGGGVVGLNACKMAIGLGARVTVFDNNPQRLTLLDDLFGVKIQTLYSQDAAIEKELRSADLVIGAVLIPGAVTPKIIKRSYLKNMKPGSVIVDVAIDQGGCCETSKLTYHDNPTFVVDGIVHYCVGNMAGAVSKTSTIALTNATLKHGLHIADVGLETAVRQNRLLLPGINCYGGNVTCKELAKEFSMEYAHISSVMN